MSSVGGLIRLDARRAVAKLEVGVLSSGECKCLVAEGVRAGELAARHGWVEEEVVVE